MLFGLNFDTQTGIKAFNRHALSQWKANSFAFDIEILSKCKDQGLTIIEIPVDVTGSKPMNPKSIIKCFIESLKIWRRRINENKDNN